MNKRLSEVFTGTALLGVLFVLHSLTLGNASLTPSPKVATFKADPSEKGLLKIGIMGGGDSDFEFNIDFDHGSVSSEAVPIPTRDTPREPADLRACGTFNYHRQVFVSPNGLWRVECSVDSPVLLTNNITDATIKARLPSGSNRDGMAWSPDGSKLAVVTERMYVELFSVQGIFAALMGHPPQLTKYTLWIVDTATGHTRKIAFFPEYMIVGGGAWLHWNQ